MNNDAVTYYRETLASELEKWRGRNDVFDALVRYGSWDQELDLFTRPDYVSWFEEPAHAVETLYEDCVSAGLGNEVLDLVIPFWEQRQEPEVE